MNFLVIPLRMLGLAAAGFALGAGWKLGAHLVDVTLGKEPLFGSGTSSDGQSADRKALLERRFEGTQD